MEHGEGTGAHLPHGTGSCRHQPGDIRPIGFAAHISVGFVADLHHAHVHARIDQLSQGFLRIPIQCVGLFLYIHSLPRLRHHLLARIRPEIGIVEINEQFQSCRGGTAADIQSVLNIAVAAAVSVPVPVKGIVPHPDTDIIDSVIPEDLKHVPLHAVVIGIADSARFQSRHAGSIHSQDEIPGQILNALHSQRLGLHGVVVGDRPPISTCRSAGG